MQWHIHLLTSQLLWILISSSFSSGQNVEGSLRSSEVGEGELPFGARLNKATPTTTNNNNNNREGRTLVNTFPFNAGHDNQHDHHQQQQQQHHHDHQHDDRNSRQQSQPSPQVSLDIGTIAAAGERCIEKVTMVEETEYDDQIECHHSYNERCHTTYKTDYEPQQEEECDENFRKDCYIEYKKVAVKEPVRFCYQPLVRNCNIPGPTECTTEYRSECITRYHEHDVDDDVPNCVDETELKCQQVTQGYTTEEQCTSWPIKKCSLERQKVKKYSPVTECKKVPFELCGPSACPVEPGPEECQDKEDTIVQEVPEEVCSLEPQRECKHVTKLVPLLKPAENCVDVPKEVCVRSRTNPRRIQKPIVKKWCYTPTKESGLETDSDRKGTGNVTPRPTLPPPPPPPQGCVRGYPADHCPSIAGDQQCNPECNTAACDYDGGDCRPPPPPPVVRPPPPPPQGCVLGYPVDHCPSVAGDGRCNPECNTPACGGDGGDCRPPPPPTRPPPTRPPPPQTRPPPPPTRPPPPPPPQGCLAGYPATYCPQRARNGECEPECDTAACGFDGGDCKPQKPTAGYLPPPPARGY